MTAKELAQIQIDDCCYPVDPKDGKEPWEYVCNHYLLLQRFTELYAILSDTTYEGQRIKKNIRILE